MFVRTRRAHFAILLVAVTCGAGCMHSEGHCYYITMQEDVIASTWILQSMGVKVPWEYVRKMLQAPDYTVPYNEIGAFLDGAGSSEFARATETEIREGTREEDRTRALNLKPWKVMFYDEAAHYRQPWYGCMGFTGAWYLVAENGEIMYAGDVVGGRSLRKAGLRYKTREGE